jgi:Domain of unknown function (DUF4149)
VNVVRFLYLLALGVWVGEIVCFSFVVAPAVFTVLGPARAGEVVSAIFPRYYLLGAGAAAAALLCGLVLRRAATSGWWTVALGCVALGLAATIWSAAVLHPRAQRLRATLEAAGQAPATDAAFRRLHGTAVALNGAALLAGVLGLGLSAGVLRH